VKITRTSMLTGIERTLDLDVTQEQIEKWEGGMFIQDAMPHLSADHWEFLISGCIGSEWNRFMKRPD
jgi:hypothetical protein